MTEGTKTMEVKGYFADDGKFFTDKDECEDYEMQLLRKKYPIFSLIQILKRRKI